MKTTLLTTAVLAALGLGASTLPSAALPVTAGGVNAPANADLVQVRMSRRMMRRHSMRGNANMPSRMPGQKQYGQTTGGPRR